MTPTAVIDALHDAIVVVDDRGLVRDINAAAEQLFARQRDDALGGRFVNLFLPPAARPSATRRLRRHLRAGPGKRSRRPWAEVMNRADGGAFHASATLVTFRHGGACWLACVVRDLDTSPLSIDSAREADRAHLARELHDELGQRLTAIRIDLGWLAQAERKRSNADVDVLERLAGCIGQVDSAVAEVRRLASELRPGLLDDMGLAAAIYVHARQFEARSGIHVEVEASSEPPAPPPAHALAVFRAVQELLTNVARHAGATRVVVRLRERPSSISLQVHDDGRGIGVPSDSLTSLGLLGIRERAALLGGRFRVADSPEGGTAATLTLPIPRPSSP